MLGSAPASDDFLRLVKSEADDRRWRRLSANGRMNEAQVLAKHLLRATNVMLCLADCRGLDPVEQERRRNWSTHEQELVAEVERLKAEQQKQTDDFAKQLDAERSAKEEAQKAKEEVDKNLAIALKQAEVEANRGLKFLNVVHQLSFMNPGLRVVGSHPFFEVMEGKMMDKRSGAPVEVNLDASDLPDPCQIVLDETEFDESAVAFSDLEE
ncbi:hypothetical protein RIF29_33186 [Crotalaria pallida]|uniref:Uncharacterized protein n=1 Tax=Crotalaria pallida TaxID=3830 RepID=A0AAN9E9R7_CROPI